MLLMLKSLVIGLLLSSSLQAGVTNKAVEDFLNKSFSNNRNIKSINIQVVSSMDVQTIKGWRAFIVEMNAVLKKGNRKVKQKMIWFSNGQVITQDLIDIKTGQTLKDLVSPVFKDEYYNKDNLIYGNADAKHKIVIFSDPLCPFCKSYVPNAIKYMKKYPKKFAVYYYHFPLASLHPASVELVKAAHVAQKQGLRDVVLYLYNVKLDNPRERDVYKILQAFNKTFNTNVKPSDIKSKAVLTHYKNDLDLADTLMVQGTPTVFFDGKIDKSKNKYMKVK